MTEPDYYPLTMAAEKTGYTKVHLISLAADNKLQLYVRPCGVKGIRIDQNNDDDPYDVDIEELYLFGTYKIPARTFQQYQNDRLTILDGLIPLEDNFYYNLKCKMPLKDIALLISAEDVARLSKKETVKTTSTETERQTMLKLIIGMAMDGYSYEPKKPRSDLTGNSNNSLSAKLALKGISISDDTIRKYFNEAKELL